VSDNDKSDGILSFHRSEADLIKISNGRYQELLAAEVKEESLLQELDSMKMSYDEVRGRMEDLEVIRVALEKDVERLAKEGEEAVRLGLEGTRLAKDLLAERKELLDNIGYLTNYGQFLNDCVVAQSYLIKKLKGLEEEE